MRTSWNPATYLAFAAYRARPAADLIAQLDIKVPGAIYDLGCGPGTLTRKLKDRWPDRNVIGLDSSPEMLAAAREKFSASSPGDITLQQVDIAAWEPTEPAALVFANAALHWVADHAALFPRLMMNVAAGGLFAMQMPMTADAPYHACVHRLLKRPRWHERLAGIRSHDHPLPAHTYYDFISPWATDADLWETHYHHVLADKHAVTAWASGTTLVPYLTALTDAEKQDFLADYTDEAGAVYPPQNDGKVLFTMQRVFLVATRAGETDLN